MRRAALTALAAAALLAGCGGSQGDGVDGPGTGGSGPLAWSAKPTMFTPETLPGDRILTGKLRNQSLRRVQVNLPDVLMRDARGRLVPASPVFLQGFGKNLWAPGRGPTQMPETELLRTGRIAYLRPGQEVPFTVAWHARDGRPAVVDYGAGSVPVPVPG